MTLVNTIGCTFAYLYERPISWNFWIKYFHLICHLILPKINCITLKIRSKADFKSKSQNIWQQIILFSSIVMQMICAMFSWWKNIYHCIYIPCVPHKNNCKKQNWFTWHETDRFLNNHCQECVHAYLSIHDCLSFRHEVMIGNHLNKTTKS
jgi:hypothetical protein